MISAISYLINGIVILLFFLRTYRSIPGKITKNPFSFYFLWVTFFYSIDFLIAPIFIIVAIKYPHSNLLFTVDFIGRVLFYIGAIFAVQIPLYKFFPKSKRRFALSYLYGVIGIALTIYQLYVRNVPTLNNAGIVNWHAGTILNIGMAIIMLAPWATTSCIFISEFIKSKFKLLKSLLFGVGWAFICIGAIFQDQATAVFSYIFFSAILTVGFLFTLASMFYKKED
jgi:hypothetical protein